MWWHNAGAGCHITAVDTLPCAVCCSGVGRCTTPTSVADPSCAIEGNVQVVQSYMLLINVSGHSPALKSHRYIETKKQSPGDEDQPLHESSSKTGVSRREAEGGDHKARRAHMHNWYAQFSVHLPR